MLSLIRGNNHHGADADAFAFGSIHDEGVDIGGEAFQETSKDEE